MHGSGRGGGRGGQLSQTGRIGKDPKVDSYS